MADRIGRNDPCPCGSGKKYKKCCLGTERSGQPGAAEEIRQALSGREFDSMDELDGFAQAVTAQRNRAPVEAFHGLSPEQMYRFLYFPWESPQLIAFADPLDVTPDAPIVTLFDSLAEAIGDTGLKPTAKGNLPRNLCRQAALRYLGEEGYRERTRFAGINKEEDFYELHVTRLVAELAGLVRKHKGRFILSRECRRILDRSGMAGIYPRLFRAYAEQFNWGYGDRYADLFIIQQSFSFLLFLLSRYGEVERSSAFYQDAFLNAFPAALEEGESSYTTPERYVGRCLTLRALERFVAFFGLARVEPISKGSLLVEECRTRKLPLLDHVVQFHVSV